ncbi:uncharacterized protein LOC144364093, partial [Saccoglossus kowalevskii]
MAMNGEQEIASAPTKMSIATVVSVTTHPLSILRKTVCMLQCNCTMKYARQKERSWNSMTNFTGVLSSSGLPNQHANNYLQVMRDKAQALKTDFIHQLDNQLQDIFDDFIEEVDHGTRSGRSTPVPTDESDKNKKRTNRLPDKKFVARRSVLT